MRVCRLETSSLRFPILLALASAVGCTSAQATSSVAPEEPRQPNDASAARDASLDAGSVRRDAGHLDAGNRPRPTPPAQCVPGRYEGKLSCVLSGVLPWTADIAFDLVEKQAGAGEFTTLQIVPGTLIGGMDDTFQGMFTGELKGTFDCRTGELTGTFDKGSYLLAGAVEYNFEGPLEGVYVPGDGGTPRLEGRVGPLDIVTLQVLGPLAPSGDCDWDAPRVGDVAGDAGT